MFRSSLDAIRRLLRATFPDVSRIYVNTVPTGFQRPSFFVELITDVGEHLNRAMWGSCMTWQIVYFAPEDKAGNPDVFNQLDAAEKLKAALMNAMTLTGPDGTVYHIIDVDGGPRDAEVYITVRLEAEQTRPEPEFDLMGEIDHEYKEE